MAELTDRIRSALTQTSSADTISSIKAAVIDGLRMADSTVNVHSTDYFNHTFTPDLVMNWQRLGQEERYVYLRFNDNLRYLAEASPV